LWASTNRIPVCIGDKPNYDIQVYPFPKLKRDTKLTAVPAAIAGINKNSKNKLAAYEFIKYLLSEEIQSNTKVQSGILIETPVNKKAFEAALEKRTGKESEGVEVGIDIYGTAVISVPVSQSLADQAKEIISRVEKCEILDENIMGFIYEGLEEYVEGKCTAEQAAEKIQAKATLYLNE